MSSARVQFNPIDQHFTHYETVLTLAEAAHALTLRSIMSLGFACFFPVGTLSSIEIFKM
jgi:hypothetical protein